MTETDKILEWLESNKDEINRSGMSRFGINTEKAYGISMPKLRAEAKKYRCRQDIAQELWSAEIHEARLMAGLIADPKKITSDIMDRWVADFDSWDVCDQCCLNLLWRVSFVREKIAEYAASESEFVRRTAFVLIAVLSVHDKELSDNDFMPYLQLIQDYAYDDRNFVKKAVNWALRQIGKRNISLNALAIETAQQLVETDGVSSRWIGRDALRELTSDKIQLFIAAHRA